MQFAFSPTEIDYPVNSITSSLHMILHNPRFIFSTAAWLTKTQSSVEPHIPFALTSSRPYTYFHK